MQRDDETEKIELEILRLLHENNDKLDRVSRRVTRIEQLLEFPQLIIEQLGDIMAIGNITAGSTGQFGAAVSFPAGVTPPAGYTPVITWSSPDPLVTFTSATVDASNGALPLSQQIVATVGAGDVNTSGVVGASSLAPDGTALSGVSPSFTITPATVVNEPTLTVSQLA